MRKEEGRKEEGKHKMASGVQVGVQGREKGRAGKAKVA